MQMEPALSEASESIELELSRQMEQFAGPFHLQRISEVRPFSERASK
jgi:hypothetical protein